MNYFDPIHRHNLQNSLHAVVAGKTIQKIQTETLGDRVAVLFFAPTHCLGDFERFLLTHSKKTSI